MRWMLRSGGQTGVDRAALDVALRTGLPYGGWCPRGGWAEDHPFAPGLLTSYPRLAETPSASPEQRTAWNVRDSHATLVLLRSGDGQCSPGTELTRLLAELVFLRPCAVVDMSRPEAVVATREWLRRLTAVVDDQEVWLNVAGPRESEVPGIYGAAFQFLMQLLA
ncbi:MAG: putative molybdenum carrier protein [Gemmataceae bacterium]|nr:putative molybdenum carrier protein [Gemmataceae bacterium]MDW8264882.1 putative molybdenum carrier protein [Gemmataceae bacterium]